MKIYPSQKIYVAESEIHGMGVFASKPIEKGEVIEKCLFLSFPQKNTEKIPVFFDYTFCFPRGEIGPHTHS